MAVIPERFSLLGSPKSKLLHVNPAGVPSGALPGSLRSLTLEHVFPADLLRRESLRPTASGAAARRAAATGRPADDLLLGVLRRWFWSRRPDAGFCLHGFPATLLHARVLDEWLEAREEALDACLVSGSSDHPVARHYRDFGVPVVEMEALPA